MQSIQLGILSQSVILNRGLQFIFNKIRGINVVDIDEKIEGFEEMIMDEQLDFILVSDSIFNNNSKIEKLYKTNKKLRWGILYTDDLKLNSLFNFEITLSIHDTETVLIEKINRFVERVNTDFVISSESGLSAREKEVLKEVALGLTNNEIAEKLFISQHTVITHRKKITAKLGIKTISGLTVYALLNNMIEMGDVF